MKNKKTQENKKSVLPSAATMAGIGTAAVAAVGAYWFFGTSRASQHRKTVRSWMLKARAQVLEQAEEVIKTVGNIDKKA